MQTAMRHYAEQVRMPRAWSCRCGWGSTPAVVVRAIGTDLHMDYSAVVIPRTWRRAWSNRHPGSIRVTAATLRLVEGLIRVNALAPFR